MSELDELIFSTKEEIKAAEHRLKILLTMKEKTATQGFVDTVTAAEMMGITRPTVIAMLTDGRLKGRKLGRNWQVSLDSIRNL